MKVCVVGSGGREHALAAVLSRTAEVVVTPGNAGIPQSVGTPPEDLAADLFVIGPEAPLVDGLADRLRAQGKLVLGPGADGARLEGSKAWMKEVVAAAGVPTARYRAFDAAAEAVAFLDTLPGGYVIKTDGLASGKGVFVTDDRDRAEADLRDKLAGASFGDAGRRVVVEEQMVGPELSVLAVCDGQRAVALAPAQDFKRVGDGDTGPNTGGMGAFSPAPAMSDEMSARVMRDIIDPTLAAMTDLGAPFTGILYAGLMLTSSGPSLLEYNVRFGDPECQVLMVRLKDDLLTLLLAAVDGTLDTMSVRWWPDPALTVVLAAQGYPGAYETGSVVGGLEAAAAVPDVEVFHAGTRLDGDRILAHGGRVLNVTARGATLAQARDRAYAAVDRIDWAHGFCRGDIGGRAVGREKA